MRAFVFTDQALAKHAGRFVWLSIDIDRDGNAGFVDKFRSPGVPTLFVIDGADERVVVARVASADRPQLEALFDEGERLVHSRDAADAAAAEAEGLAALGREGDAAAAWARALALGGDGWARRGRAVESRVMALSMAGDLEACAKAALDEAPRLAAAANGGALYADVVATGLGCALEVPAGVGGELQGPPPPAWRRAAITALEPRVREALALPLMADDRSGLYETLVEARSDAGDAAAAHQLAGEWLAFLEAEAARAATPVARAAFDPHRLAAAVALGEPARALAPLLASERDLPDDYNAPARLAIVYLKLGRVVDGLAACDRAARHVYGPRRLRIEETRADLYEAAGDHASARRAIESAIRLGEALPNITRTRTAVRHLRARLEKMEKP